MKIKIENTETSKAKISNVLDAVNGRASQRILTTPEVIDFAERCENRLKNSGLAQSHWRETMATINGGVVSAKSYRWAYSSTQVTIVRGGNNWFLVDAVRLRHRPGVSAGPTINLSPSAGQAYAELQLERFSTFTDAPAYRTLADLSHQEIFRLCNLCTLRG